jgi:hypothetical protein
MGKAVTRDGWLLATALRNPASCVALDAVSWTALLAMACAEQLIGSLAHRLDGLPLPVAVSSTHSSHTSCSERVKAGR